MQEYVLFFPDLLVLDHYTFLCKIFDRNHRSTASLQEGISTRQ